MRLMVLCCCVVLLSGCSGFFYSPMNVSEAIQMIEASQGSGCVYLRGNARPYGDISFLSVHAYGRNAPTYLECLEAVPPEARSLLP